MQMPTTREGLSDVLSGIRRTLNTTHNVNYLRNTGRGEDAYVALLHALAWRGVPKPSRSGGWTLGLVGEQFRCRLSEGFPILAGKKIFWKGVVAELLWFLRGDTNLRFLHAHNVHIWDEWAKPDGDVGPVYGAQWRGHRRPDLSKRAFAADQITELLAGLLADPYGRRHIVTAWNPDAVPEMGLPPCHAFWQIVCQPLPQGAVQINLVLTQRSADVFLGVPFNIASYALLMHLLVWWLNSRDEMPAGGFYPGDLVINFGDLHLYQNHIGPAQEYLKQYASITTPVRAVLEPPTFAPEKFDGWDVPHLVSLLTGYNPMPAVKAEVAV